MLIKVNPRTDALIVVDVQRDFCPGGALAVPRGDEVVPAVNRLLALTGWLTAPATGTRRICSFTAQGGIWPPHCGRDERRDSIPPR
jgi:nicotinamidase/pyrazinamidase